MKLFATFCNEIHGRTGPDALRNDIMLSPNLGCKSSIWWGVSRGMQFVLMLYTVYYWEMPKWSCLQLFVMRYMGEQAQMPSVMTSCYHRILDVNQAFDGVSAEACNLFWCYILCMIGFLLCPKQDYYGHILRHFKWAKTTNFQISPNATSLSATNQHSSKWYPRLHM